MLKLIISRLGQGVVTLFAVSVLIFICTQILPGFQHRPRLHQNTHKSRFGDGLAKLGHEDRNGRHEKTKGQMSDG